MPLWRSCLLGGEKTLTRSLAQPIRTTPLVVGEPRLLEERGGDLLFALAALELDQVDLLIGGEFLDVGTNRRDISPRTS